MPKNNTKYIFINNAINDSLIMYYSTKEKPHSVEFNSFMVTIMRMIVLLYGELDITNCYHTKNEKGMGGFDTNLTKYGLPEKKLERWKNNFEKYYEFEMRQKKLHIKRKNPFFNAVQKNMIDMMFAKNKKNPLNAEQAKEFYDMLFTANSSDFYRRTFALLSTNNPYEVDEYFRKNMFMISNKLKIVPIKRRVLAQDIYDFFGIKKELFDGFTQHQIDNINKQIYDYYGVDPMDYQKENKLRIAISEAKKRPNIRIVA